jgi:hypothetical protein
MTYKLTNTSQPADPYYGAVSLLLHGDGADGSTQVIDSSVNPKTVTVNGNAQISTTESKLNGSSLKFDGSGDYLTIPALSDFDFGTGDFTVEFWSYIVSTSDDWGRIIECGAYNDTNTWRINYNSRSDALMFQCSNSSGSRSEIATTTSGLNEWRHYAVTRSGNTIRMFVNGIREGTTLTFTDSFDAPTQLGGLSIGVGLSSVNYGTSLNNYLNGYIDDLRITKGVARYTSNFTPPTQPFIGKPIVGNDLYYYATSLLLKGDGTNGSTNIVDSSFDPKTITANGDAQISTAQSKFGGSSIAFDGAGDYISTPNNAAFDYGTSNFTIEFWYKFAATPGADQYIYSQRLDSNNFVYIYATGSSFVLYKFDGFGSLTLTGSTTHNTTTWSHLAAVRNGTTFTLYKDGTALNSITNNATFASLGVQLDIGIWSGPSPSLAFNGYIDDLRITKGIARYTSNFTPPGPLPTY